MAENSKIEWTDATWNVLRGCTRVSEGCRNCYAEGIAARFSDPGQPFEGIAKRTSGGPRWTGKVSFAEHLLDQPLRWKRPRRIFVNSMSDVFHEAVPDEWIDRMFAVMAMAPQHSFQVLTKRPERARAYLTELMTPTRLVQAALRLPRGEVFSATWPLPNVWIGTSVEDQTEADRRIPHLLAVPAAVRFLSCEPLLGPVDLRHWIGVSPVLPFLSSYGGEDGFRRQDIGGGAIDGLHWIIAGGESGRDARPMHPDWARSLRDQCAAAGVPFFMKQMGGTRKPFQPIPDDLMIRGFPNAAAA